MTKKIPLGLRLRARRDQLSLLLRFGPPTLDAYLKIARTVMSERLWSVPPRPLRAPAPDRSLQEAA